jgi:hypothetical protein
MIPLAAIMSIGEKVLDKVLPDPEAKAKAMAELKRVEQEGRLAELNADNIEAQELTKRLEADMKSDSWLSKNIQAHDADLHPADLHHLWIHVGLGPGGERPLCRAAGPVGNADHVFLLWRPHH